MEAYNRIIILKCMKKNTEIKLDYLTMFSKPVFENNS